MMKRFIILGLLIFFIIALHANGECLLRDIQKKSTCSGGAANIDNETQNQANENNQTYKQDLKQMYQIPTMATPFNFNNGFPLLNQNCMFGACFPK